MIFPYKFKILPFITVVLIFKVHVHPTLSFRSKTVTHIFPFLDLSLIVLGLKTNNRYRYRERYCSLNTFDSIDSKFRF